MSAEHVAADCRGMNFWRADRSLRDLLALRLPGDLLARLEPHLDRLGELAGGRLDELARAADAHPPVLHPRDRSGRDEDWIEYHPAYREMERIAFGEFGLHAMSHRPGVLGLPHAAPAVAKYAFQYLFVQAEFGLMCPISVTDTAAYVIGRHGAEPLRRLLLPRMLTQDLSRLWKGAQFMTETAGGSDVGALETAAEPLDADDGLDRWRLFGDKWFCSHADADVALVLARPRGAAPGTRGLALYAMPRRLPDGRRNAYRIVRLKDKLGSRSMASGEIRLEGAIAYLVGGEGRGLRQMLDQVNFSRLSHGVRAAGMMRRCLQEAMAAARSRRAFGRPVVEHPLLRRQLMKVLLPAEQALSVALYTAQVLDRAQAGDEGARSLLRILTPLLKLRACRDNVAVASGALEVRGGNGYIEEWVNARLLRDAQLGTIWEGTSNVNALDVVARAVGRHRAHEALAEALRGLLDHPQVPEPLGRELGDLVVRATAAVGRVAADPGQEERCRAVAGALYHVASAVLLAREGAELAAGRGDARRLLLARLVLRHRVRRPDPLEEADDRGAAEAADLLLGDAPIPLEPARVG
jgi:acyl-CoA dehydrogenase